MKNMMKRGNQVGRKVWEEMKRFWKDEDAMGSVEVILIVVVLVGLVVIFRTQVTKLVSNAFKQLKTDGDQATAQNSVTTGYSK